MGVVGGGGDLADADGQDLEVGVAALQDQLAREYVRSGVAELLAGGVRGQHGQAVVGHGTDVEDERGAVAEELGQQVGLHEEGEDGVEVDVVDEAGVGAVLEELVDGVDDAPASVVDEHGKVDVCQRSGDGVEVDGAGGRLRVGVGVDVSTTRAGRGPAATAGDGRGVRDQRAKLAVGEGGHQLVGDAGQLGRVPAVQDDVEAAGGQLVAELLPDAVGGAGDEGPW